MEELEMEMEIGLPTNVKHVTHIGFDDPLAHDTKKCNQMVVSEFLSQCQDSATQYEQCATHVPIDATHGMHNTCNKPVK